MEDFRIKISSQLDLKDAETKIKNFINTYNNKNINLNVELGKSFNANNIVKDISKVQRQVNQKIKGFKINNVNDDFVAGFIKNLQRQADEAEKVTKRFGKNLKKINETKYDRNAMAAIKAEERESKRIAKEQERENKRILEEKIKDINISNREREKLDKKNLSIRKKNAEAILREELSLIDKQKQIEAKIFKNENGGNKNLVYYYKNQRKQVEKELGLLKNELNKNYSDIYSKTEHDSILKNKSLESKGIVDLAKAKHKDDLKRKNNIIRQKEFKSYSNAYTDAYQSIGVKSNTLKKMAEYYENLEIESKKNYNKYKQIKSKISQGSLDVSTSSVRKKLDSFSGIDSQYLVKAESSYKKLLALQKELTTGKSLADGSKLSNEQMIARWNRFGSILKKVQNQTKVLGNEFGNIAKPFSKIDAEIASNKTLTWLNKNTKAVKEYGDKLKELAELQAKATSNRELNKYNKEFKKITSEAAAKGKTGLSLKDDFKRAFGQIFQFAGTYGMIQNVAFEIPRQIANEVKAIDSAKIELTKVSSASTGQLSAYWNEAAASAKKYGSTIDNVIKTTADWSRLGYGLEDAKKLSNATTLMQTIGDNMTQESASEGLISTLRGFQLRASEVDNIVDKINEVSNTQPIDTAGIFEGLKRSASSMSAANNTLEETIGLITAANSVVQDPAKVGTGFKTISMRIRGAKTELEEAGLETEGMAESTAKLREEIMALSGVDIMLNPTTFKSTYQIMEELSSKWENLSDIQQATITELIAGKRQGNLVSALMKNFDIAQKTLDTAVNGSFGSAERELDKKSKGIEFRLQRLKATFQKFSTTALSSDLFKGFIDGGTLAVSVVEKLIDTFGGLTTAVGVFAGYKAFKNFDKVKDVVELFKIGAKVSVEEKSFKGLADAFSSFPKAASIAKMASLVGLMYASAKTFKYYEDSKQKQSYSALNQKASDAYSDYESEKNKVKELNDQLVQTKSRVEDLQSKGKLSLTEEAELTRLKEQTKELERQQKVAENLSKAKLEKAAKKAYRAVTNKNYKTKQDEEDLKTLYNNGFVDKYDGYAKDTYATGTKVDQTKADLDNLKSLKEERNALYKKYDKANEKNKSKYASQITDLDAKIAQSEADLTTTLGSLKKNRDTMIESGNPIYQEQIDLINDLDLAFEKSVHGLSKQEYQLKKTDNYFKRSGLEFVKQQLIDMSSKSKLTADDIKRMGVAIDGVDASTIAKYFNDMANSAQKAADATTKFGTLAEYEKALETKNPGEDYLKITEGLKATKELYDKGLVGTDEFKAYSKMLSPTGKTDADNFIENYKYLKKYFTSDSKSGANSFLKALSKETNEAGEAFAKFDKKTGEWKLNIEDTTEAAKALQMGIVPFEAMLGRLKDYDFDIEFTSAVEQFSDVKTALIGFDSILDKMSDGEKKNALSKQVDGWKSQLGEWEKDLSTLDTDIAMKIKLEYSLAEIQAQIDEFKSKIDWGNATSENYSNVLAGNDKYISQAKEGLGLNQKGVELPVQFTNIDSSIDELRSKLASTTDEESKVKIQAEIEGLQNIQKDILDAFSDAHPEINIDSSIDEIKSAWKEFVESNEYNEILGNYDIDTTNAKVKIKEIENEKIVLAVNASTEELQQKLWDLKQGQTLIFYADVDGLLTEINAVRNEDGTISYSAYVDGAEKEVHAVLNKDGTINYTLGEYPDKVPNAKQEVNRYANNSKISKDPKGIKQKASRYAFNPSSIFNPLKSITQKVKRIFVGGSNLAGTAHFGGSAYSSGTFDNSFIKNEWKTTKDDVALTGEVGQEIVAHGNKWWTVGDNGAEFSYIPANSVVFNAQQSKELLEKGHITSRGTAHLSGTAYLGDAHGKGSFSGGGSNGKSSSSKKKKSSSKDKNKDKDKAEEVLDWIATLLERVERQTRISIDAIDDAIGLVEKQAATAKAIDDVQNQILQNQKAREGYLKKANSLGLSSSYVNKIKNGTISIETVTDENLKKKISDYQNWFEAAQKCEDTIRDLKKQEKELNERRLKNIEEWHDAIVDVNKAMIDVAEAKQELNEKLGTAINLDVNTSEIKNAIKAQQETYNQLVQKLSDYQKEFNAQVSSGKIKQNSDAWFEGQENIQKFTAEIYKASSELIEFQDKLREIEYDTLQHLIDGFERAVSKIDAHISLLESRDEVIPESMYIDKMNNNNSQIVTNYDLRNKKIAEQSLYDVNSKRYQELAEEINKIDEETLGLMEDNEKLKDSIFELRFTPLDEALDKYKKLRSETDSFYELLNKDAFFDKNGNGTSDLAAGIALIQQGMATAKQEIKDYQTGLNKLQESLDNGVISQKEYNEKSEEYRDGLQDAVHKVKDYKDSLTDLYMTQLKTEVENTEKLIDKYAEARKKKEDYFEYDRKLKKQQKSVDLIKAQIAALDGVNNSAAKAQKKRLEQELRNEQEALDDLKRDHKNEMMDLGDDKLKEDLNTLLDDTAYAVAHSAEKQESVINKMLDNVLGKYQEVYGKINSIIFNTGWVGSPEFNKNQEQLGSQIGAQAQKDNASLHQSDVLSSSTANSTVTDKIVSNDKHNSKIEQEITKPIDNSNRKVAEVKLSPSSVTIQEGSSTSITVTIRPNDAKNKSISWTSSNNSVASISGGTIHAYRPGSCTITAMTNDGSGLSATVSVNVTARPMPKPPQYTPPSNTPSFKPNASSGGDGVPRVGDKVTFVNGSYYYDSAGKRPAGSKYHGKTVYITRINGKSWAKRPIHISTGSRLGKGDLGWLRQDQISGYATGTKGIASDIELARIDEQGKELRIKRGGDKYDIFQYGDGVVPKGLTDNLFTLAQHANEVMANLNPSEFNSHIEINEHYDSLLTVNGNVDRDALPDLQTILEESFKYNTKRLHDDMKKSGHRKKIRV